MTDRINFLIACAPNWIDLDAGTLSAGGEVSGLGVSLLRTNKMHEHWRSPSLKPHHTVLDVVYEAGAARPSRAIFLGKIVIPEAGSYYRVRRGEELTERRLRPQVHAEGAADAFLEATNATGSPHDLVDDPLAPGAAYVTPTDVEQSMTVRLALPDPHGGAGAGARRHTLRISYAPTDTTVANPDLDVEIYQAGSPSGITGRARGWPAGEAGHWILDVKFDVADLADPSGADLELRAVTAPAFGDTTENIKLAAVQWIYEPATRIRPADVEGAFLAATNTGEGDPGLVYAPDPFDEAATTLSAVEPETLGSAMDFRIGFDDPGLGEGDGGGNVGLAATADAQTLVAAVQRTAAGGDPTVELELWIDGSATALSESKVLTDDEIHYLVIRWSASELGAATAADVEARILTTPDGGQNVKVYAVGWLAALDRVPWDYDSGWLEAFPPLATSLWGEIIPETVGKPVPRSIAHPYTASSGELVTLTARRIRFELLFEPEQPGEWSYTDRDGNLVTWLDASRLAEGPALSGMNLAGGFEVQAVDLSRVEETPSGVLWEDEEPTYRLFRLRLTNLVKEVAVGDLFDYLFRRLGVTGDVLLMIFPEDPDFRRIAFVWGPLRDPKLTHDHGTRFRSDLEVRERL